MRDVVPKEEDEDIVPPSGRTVQVSSVVDSYRLCRVCGICPNREEESRHCREHGDDERESSSESPFRCIGIEQVRWGHCKSRRPRLGDFKTLAHVVLSITRARYTDMQWTRLLVRLSPGLPEDIKVACYPNWPFLQSGGGCATGRKLKRKRRIRRRNFLGTLCFDAARMPQSLHRT